jgi:hypothetical protein
MVDLEDAQVWVWIAVREGIQACAKQHILFDLALYSDAKVVFGITAAPDDVSAHGGRIRTVWPKRRSAYLLCIGSAEDRHGNGVIENERIVEELMGSAAQSDSECGAGWGRVLHYKALSFAAASRKTSGAFQLIVISFIE